MSHSHPGTTPSRWRRLMDRIKATPKAAGRAVERTDIWVQDHSILATTLALTLFLAVTGIAMWKWGEAILTLARQYQPLFTIVWIAISAILLILGTFRTRRAARLAAAASATAEANTATPRTADTPTQTGTPGATTDAATDNDSGDNSGAGSQNSEGPITSVISTPAQLPAQSPHTATGAADPGAGRGL
ncbi:hypothetical protein [Streptomyces sp. NPDC049949]|uniref:hypothetical protein n=1 Tax=Streptomyces sp. NPDC049949 TaxID=3154627 RepID=UPI00342E14AB